MSCSARDDIGWVREVFAFAWMFFFFEQWMDYILFVVFAVGRITGG